MIRRFAQLATVCTVLTTGFVPQAGAGVTAFGQAVAESAAEHAEVAAFYRARNFAPIWTGADEDDAARRRALVASLADKHVHGLPRDRYEVADVRAILSDARTERRRGEAEVALSRLFLHYASDLGSGVIDPNDVVPGIKRERPTPDGSDLLDRLATEAPAAFFASLAPSSPEYPRLLAAKLRLEEAVEAGGWGPTVRSGRIERGDSGPAVVELRDRLIRMGYLQRTAKMEYESAVETAVRRFQAAHGLAVDGIVGPGTLAELNVAPRDRLGQVLVALERERWTNFDRGARHVWVNLTDFSAALVDHGKVTFRTRTVIGSRESDRRSPEFSDVMEHMVLNPTWHVPRSIAVKEYLPQLQRNPAAAGHLRLINSRGQTVNRAAVDFTQFNARNFPFAMKQPPSRSNALGLVKFMFPNRWNIYLHDTPAKSLFDREVRAFSHGCIRLSEPFEFAYHLLSRQTDDPEGMFHRTLDTGRETRVELDQHVPVHIVYRTAFTTPKGELQFRRDVYGRDDRLLDALREAGVVLVGPQS